jgi:copper(I)-binding protein
MTKRIFFGALLCVFGCSGAGDPILSYENDDVAVYNAFAPSSPAPNLATVYFSLVNKRERRDSLVEVIFMAAGRTEMHTVQNGMVQVSSIPMDSRGTVDMEPGSYHVMLLDLVARLELGDTIDVTLRFAEAEEAHIRAPVLTYTEVVQNLRRGVPR